MSPTLFVNGSSEDCRRILRRMGLFLIFSFFLVAVDDFFPVHGHVFFTFVYWCRILQSWRLTGLLCRR